MKWFGIFIFMSFIAACDPYGFGFKMNPAYVLNEAFEAVLSQDPADFIKVTGKEALCIYGNDAGMAYLKENLNINSEEVEIKPKLVVNSSQYTNTPQYVGFWSYYNESYEVDILDKSTKAEFLKVLVECHYGFEGEKNVEYQHMKLKKYKRKECKVIKVIPFKFAAMPLSQDCEPLRVSFQSQAH